MPTEIAPAVIAAVKPVAPVARVRARRIWFPPAWIAFWALVWGALWAHAVYRQGDWGLVNSAGHACVILGSLGLTIWVLRSSGLSWGRRWIVGLAPLTLVALHYTQLSPVETIHNGDVGIVGWRWRWAEPDLSLETLPEVPTSKSPERSPLAWAPDACDYPRFLGGGPWAEAHGVEIDVERLNEPPRELWRRKIGAGWSAFAVVGNLAVTQEQRGALELVSCYDLRDGRLVWSHADGVRWDPKGAGALGYPGPRATPTLYEGRVLAHGATGILNCLDASSGALLWSHDTLGEHGAKNIVWGKSGSVLAFGNLAVVSVGASDASLVAYDLESGDLVWKTGYRRSSYASPALMTLAGVEQVVSVDEGAVTSHRASDGQSLWEYEWPSESDSAPGASQPVPVGDDRLFVSKGYGLGSSLFRVRVDADEKWSCQRLWKKTVMKTKMGNVAVRRGYVYGLDDVYLQCIELASGKSQWKKRRRPSFGHGQLMLVGERLLIVTEEGEVVLVDAAPERYNELASFPGVTGLTWNNPALAGPYLLVRNAEEAVCFELPLKEARHSNKSSPNASNPDVARSPAANLRE